MLPNAIPNKGRLYFDLWLWLFMILNCHKSSEHVSFHSFNCLGIWLRNLFFFLPQSKKQHKSVPHFEWNTFQLCAMWKWCVLTWKIHFVLNAFIMCIFRLVLMSFPIFVWGATYLFFLFYTTKQRQITSFKEISGHCVIFILFLWNPNTVRQTINW